MKIRHFGIMLLVLLTGSWSASSYAASKKPDITQAITTWKSAVESGKLNDIMELYDKKAVMIPTFGQNPITTRDKIESYYKLIVANEGIKVDILETHPRLFGDIAIDDGRYEVSYLQEGEQVSIPARFTFVYKLIGGKWMIIDHHASQMPDKKEKK